MSNLQPARFDSQRCEWYTIFGYYLRGGNRMCSKIPIIRKIAWVALVPQLTLMFSLFFVFCFFIPSTYLALMASATTFLFLSFSLRGLIALNHRKGVFLSKRGYYEQAIEAFRTSYDFFLKYEWVDQFRYITMLSSSRFYYREMALMNMAFCYTKLGEFDTAKELYQKTRALFPENELVRESIDTIPSDWTQSGDSRLKEQDNLLSKGNKIAKWCIIVLNILWGIGIVPIGFLSFYTGALMGMLNDSGMANEIGLTLMMGTMLLWWAIPITIILAILLSFSFRKKQYFMKSIFIQVLPFVHVFFIILVIMLISKIGFS